MAPSITKVTRPWMKKSQAQKNKSWSSTGFNYHSAAWRRLRNVHIKDNPVCVICGHPAEVVDHIKPIAEGGEGLDPNNLQSLCFRHHAKKSGAESVKRSRKRK